MILNLDTIILLITLVIFNLIFINLRCMSWILNNMKVYVYPSWDQFTQFSQMSKKIQKDQDLFIQLPTTSVYPFLNKEDRMLDILNTFFVIISAVVFSTVVLFILNLSIPDLLKQVFGTYFYGNGLSVYLIIILFFFSIQIFKERMDEFKQSRQTQIINYTIFLVLSGALYVIIELIFKKINQNEVIEQIISDILNIFVILMNQESIKTQEDWETISDKLGNEKFNFIKGQVRIVIAILIAILLICLLSIEFECNKQTNFVRSFDQTQFQYETTTRKMQLASSHLIYQMTQPVIGYLLIQQNNDEQIFAILVISFLSDCIYQSEQMTNQTSLTKILVKQVRSNFNKKIQQKQNQYNNTLCKKLVYAVVLYWYNACTLLSIFISQQYIQYFNSNNAYDLDAKKNYIKNIFNSNSNVKFLSGFINIISIFNMKFLIKLLFVCLIFGKLIIRFFTIILANNTYHEVMEDQNNQKYIKND